MKKIFALAAIAFVFAFTTAMTNGAKVDYTADRSIQTNEGAFEQKIYVSLDKERSEFAQDGTTMAMIMRFDKKLMWNCMIGEGMCMEMALDESRVRPDQDDDYRIELTNEGQETINGITANKSKMLIYEKKTGKKVGGGLMWTTGDGINVKTDYLIVEDDGKKSMVKFELKNLKVGKVDPAMFEIPKGYEKMNMGGFGGMMGGGRKGSPNRNPGSGQGNMMPNIGDLMKGMGR
jgi:hypothetical protein